MFKGFGSKSAIVSVTLSDGAIRYLALAISLVLAILLAVLNPEGPFERSIHNIRDAINAKSASGKIHLVEIDAKSLSSIDSWPWPRRHHAQLIDVLVESGAEQIVFDVDFSSHSSDAEDQALAAAIARADGKVVLPTFLQGASDGQTSQQIENLPVEILREYAFLGSVNVQPDRAGQVNTYPFGTITEATARPSIGALLANASGPISKEFKLDQSIKIDTIPRHSFVDVMNGRFDRAAIKGKRIIIGATAIELGDRYATSRYGVIPGVVIQALAAETLIAGPVAPDFGPWPLLGFTLVALIISIRLLGNRGLIGPLSAIGIAASVFLLTLVAERFGIAHIDLAPSLLLLTFALIAHYFISLIQKAAKERRVDRDTGLPNMASWQIEATDRRTSTVVVAEMLNLGQILSTLGEADSTQFLRAVASRLELSCSPGKLYRIGREHFCWSLDALTSDEAEVILESTAHLFNAPLLISGRLIRATMCFGAAKGNMADPVALSNKATLAARRAGEIGVRSIWHDENLAQDTDLSLFILSEFDAALKTGQISIVYQPKYSLAKRCVTAAEALVRWHHPDKGTISPAIFVPILERENLLEPLTVFALRQVLDDMAQWNVLGRTVGCAINISPSLLGNSAFLDRAMATIGRSKIDLRLLTFELTETAVISSLEFAVSALDQFKQLGIQLSIDDYGTGQSTLSYLKSFAADEIKIDQSFVRLVATDNANRIMVRSSIEMAHALGMRVVAEGVEDAEAMAVLSELGCDMIQGWHIGRAVSNAEFIRLWRDAEGKNGETSAGERQARRA
jgi:diguanylate cyclase